MTAEPAFQPVNPVDHDPDTTTVPECSSRRTPGQSKLIICICGGSAFLAVKGISEYGWPYILAAAIAIVVGVLELTSMLQSRSSRPTDDEGED